MANKHQRQQAIRAMRGKIWSPGRPSTARREDRVRFWEGIARGLSSDDAAGDVGVSSAVGTRWFRDAGGMPPLTLAPVSGRYLSFTEREEIAILHSQQLDRLRDYVQDRLAGTIAKPDGELVAVLARYVNSLLRVDAFRRSSRESCRSSYCAADRRRIELRRVKEAG